MKHNFQCSGEAAAYAAGEGDSFPCPHCWRDTPEAQFVEAGGDWICGPCAQAVSEYEAKLVAPAAVNVEVSRLTPLTREEMILAATKPRTAEQQARLEQIWYEQGLIAQAGHDENRINHSRVNFHDE